MRNSNDFTEILPVHMGRTYNRWDPDIDRNRNYKMTAAEPERVTSHVSQQTDMRFQRQYRGFRGGPTLRTHRRNPPMMTDAGNTRWRWSTGIEQVVSMNVNSQCDRPDSTVHRPADSLLSTDLMLHDAKWFKSGCVVLCRVAEHRPFWFQVSFCHDLTV
jgi:hypothetical protein